MRDTPFKLTSTYQPSGDQPQAIEKLLAGLEAGEKEQTLLGVTGSGKTFTMAATGTAAKRGALYSPSGPGRLGGPPSEQRLYPPLRSAQEAARVWQVSEELTKVFFPVAV